MNTTQLTTLGVIRISGEDKLSYMQGQLTCDMNQLADGGCLTGAHCNAKGKMWSNFVLLEADNQYYMVMHRAVLPLSLAALKKYAVFSKVDIDDISEQLRVCVAPVDTPSDTAAIAQAELAIECRLLLKSDPLAAAPADEDRWHLHFIQYGFPWLANAEQVEQFVPQMLSLEKLDAISFSKGCYIGQETVARMRYLGKQNRELCYLRGEAETISPNDLLERNLGESWKRSGTVINAVQDPQQQWHILAVLPTDIGSDAEFRIINQENSRLAIHIQV